MKSSFRFRAAIAAVAAIALLSILPAFAAAQQAKLPPAEKILDAYVQALGGVKAFDKIQNTRVTAALAIPAMGITIDVKAYSVRPNITYSLASSPMIGSIERGTDGAVFWEKSTMQGARLLEGEELEDAIGEAAFENLVYWRANFDSVAAAGVDTVDGSPAYLVVMKPKHGKTRTLAFDQKSGLLVKSISKATTQMGEIPVESFVSDYRKAGEVLQSYKTVMKLMNQERIVTVSSIEQNVAVPDSVLALPGDVKELAAQAKAGKKE